MFDKGKIDYKSDIELGKKYKDSQTSVVGVATSIYFYQHACERVCLERLDQSSGKILENIFDAPRLESVETGKKATAEKTGGPGDGHEMRPSPTR